MGGTPGSRFQFPVSGVPAVRASCANSVLPVFLHDGYARSAHDRRFRAVELSCRAGISKSLPRELFRARRNDRPLLALRRHRLDFLIPAVISDWASQMTTHVHIPKVGTLVA